MTMTMYGGGSEGWLTTWTPEKVVAAPDPVVAFAEYTQQVLGVPWPTLNDMRILRRKVKDFFAHYPRLNFFTLCRVVTWAKREHRRFGRVWAVVEAFRDAFKAGALPELDPPESEQPIEARITAALAVETNTTWRRVLLGATGVDARRRIIEQWTMQRGVAHGIH